MSKEIEKIKADIKALQAGWYQLEKQAKGHSDQFNAISAKIDFLLKQVKDQPQDNKLRLSEIDTFIAGCKFSCESDGFELEKWEFDHYEKTIKVFVKQQKQKTPAQLFAETNTPKFKVGDRFLGIEIKSISAKRCLGFEFGFENPSIDPSMIIRETSEIEFVYSCIHCCEKHDYSETQLLAKLTK
jgi:hypothetical protein